MEVKCNSCGLTSELTEESYRCKKYRKSQKCKKCDNAHLYLMVGEVVNNLEIISYGKPTKYTDHNVFVLKCCDCENRFQCRAHKMDKVRCSKCHRNNQMLGDSRSKRTVNSLVSVARGNAKSRGLHFNITEEDVINLLNIQDGKCALSGVPITIECDLSIDRIDSLVGYEITNIQLVHKVINVIKNSLTQKDFIDWCQKVAKYNSIITF